MKILLVEPRGFCAGVKMAIRTLCCAIVRFGPPIYVYHEIVHNTWVVYDFQQQGVVFVDSLDDVPDGARLVFSAHGVAPSIRAAAQLRGIHTIDATCPLVNRVHQKVRTAAAEGAKIVLIGHPSHDEVVGVLGEAPDKVTLISSIVELDQMTEPNANTPLFDKNDRIVVVTQTTLSVDDTQSMFDELQRRYPQTELPSSSDICYATHNRQHAIRTLAAEVDCVCVVGSPTSSNSRRLAEIGRAAGLRAMMVDGPEDFSTADFHHDDRVLMTAGASAPEEVVQACVEKLRQNFHAEIEERKFVEERVHFPLPEM